MRTPWPPEKDLSIAPILQIFIYLQMYFLPLILLFPTKLFGDYDQKRFSQGIHTSAVILNVIMLTVVAPHQLVKRQLIFWKKLARYLNEKQIQN